MELASKNEILIVNEIEGKIKIAIVVEAVLGGIRQHVCDITCGLDKEKFDIYFIYSEQRADDTFFKQIHELNECATLIKCNEMQRELGIWDIVAYKKLVCILKKINPDVVHCHSSKAGIVGRLAAKRCDIKKIIYTPNAYAFQSPDISRAKKALYIGAERVLSRFATDITINVSKGEMAEAQKYKLDKKEKFKLIYNGIPDKKLPSKEQMRGKLGLSNEIKYVGFTGRCAAQKDPFTFLEIAKAVVKQCDDVEFLYIGDGELFDHMQEWIIKEELSNKIHMLGFRSDAEEIVGGLDIYLSTALYEGLPYSMIEAMRAGVPIIATDCVGNNELVFPRENGWLFQCKDWDGGAKLVLNQFDEEIIISSAVREMYKQEFSLDSMMNKLTKTYLS